MKTIDIGPALAAAQQVKAGIDKLQARRTELQAKIGELKERIAVLWRAPLSRAEIKAQMLDAIEEKLGSRPELLEMNRLALKRGMESATPRT